MVTTRTSSEPTPQELQIFEQFCTDHDIVTDGKIGEQNVLALGDYLLDTWRVEITEDTLRIALEKLREAGRITFYTPAQAKYKRIAAENIDRANALNNWFHTANTSLVKDDDLGLENQAVLLSELRGRDITPKTIQDAIGRASLKSGLHFVPIPLRVDPRQHADDGKGFMPKDSANLTARDHAARRGADAAAAAGVSAPKPTVDYRTLAEGITTGRTHSDSLRLQRLYVMVPGTSDVDWEATYVQRRRIADRKGR